MEKHDTLSSLVMLVFSLIVAMYSYKLGLGSATNPEAGFSAFWIAVVLGCMSMLLLLWSAAQLFKKTSRDFFNLKTYLKPIFVTFTLFFYAVFFKLLGFLLVTFILTGFLQYTLGKESLKKSMLVSAIITGFAYILFVIALRIALPEGILGYVMKGV